MATYKTPGVYVEEIAKFPPSVAQVETAIPAFIGFTEFAKKKIKEDLHLVPKRITSLLEYETFFGSAKPEENITVTVSGTDITATGPGSSRSPFLMYYSLQLYFANGGGPCYITSVGQYGEDASSPVTLVTMDPLSDGLAEIRKVDEPTLLLFPDATSMDSDSHNDFYSLYNAALSQCNSLQDRFTIMDTFSDKEYEADSIAYDPIEEFRNKISSEKDYAKYGAVYYPFLETILDYKYDESKIAVEYGDGIDLGDWVDTLISSVSASGLESSITSLIALKTSTEDVAPGAPSFTSLKASIRSNVEGMITQVATLKTKFDSILAVGREETADAATISASDALDAWITDKLEALTLLLNTRLDDLNGILSGGAGKPGLTALISGASDSLYEALGYAAGAASTATIITDISGSLAGAGVAGALSTALNALPSGGGASTTLDMIATSDNLLYNKIKNEISQLPIYMPPSSAIAGIYARIDKNNGVWKAPANVNLAYVSKPTVNITHEEQADMNVHTTGKSVNAIRTFTGKGTMVWGARTLAGNDNEWRYVPVRRFFNMVEESVKKASEQFVFEGNDANTWVRIRAMIENFLNLQWRAGALTGAKPEQAYYVRVGLGQTMTAEDILNGYMNIEIGMAVVRPAEFIVLKFSHKMQEA